MGPGGRSQGPPPPPAPPGIQRATSTAPTGPSRGSASLPLTTPPLQRIEDQGTVPQFPFDPHTSPALPATPPSSSILVPAPIAPAPKTTAPTPTTGDMDCDNGPKAGRRKADLNRSSEDLKRVRISEVPEVVMIPAHGEDDQQPILPLQQEPTRSFFQFIKFSQYT